MDKKTLSFKDAILGTEGLEEAFMPGLKALGSNSCKIRSGNPRNILGSINLEKALRNHHPNEPIWDYGVGFVENQRQHKAIWIEIHPASSSHIHGMLNKIRWLKKWLNDNARELNKITREYVWIASGKVALQKHSPQMKKVALEKISFVGEIYHC